MTLQEMLAREAIRRTMARYTTAGDRLKVAEFRAVFTEDGVLESDGVAARDQFHFRGRDQIGAWLERWLQPAQAHTGQPQASFVRHHLSTCDIDITDAGSARARTYWTAYTDIGADHGGYYLDTFHKVGDEWLIAHRRVRMDWRAPNSLFVSAVSRTR